MAFPVLVQPDNGQFSAQLVGEHGIRIVRPTRDEAVAALESELRRRIELGELVSIDVPGEGRRGAAAVSGKFADDPTLDDICEEIYLDRDRQCDELPG